MSNKAQIQISFVENAIDVENASLLPSLGCGGECIFIGRTRSEKHDTYGQLSCLLYDCYRHMAETELISLAEEAINRFGVLFVKVTHSIGRVDVDEASVVIAVASNHRDDAFVACRFMIDMLKQRVPIWKQEQWVDGTTWPEGAKL